MAGERSTAKIVGITCGVLALVGCCTGAGLLAVCGGGVATVVDAVSGPKDAGQAFLGDVRAGNFQAAHQRMNANYQSTRDVGTFQNNLAQVPGLLDHTDATFTSLSVNNNVGTASGTLHTPQGDRGIEVQATLLDGFWYLDRIVVDDIALP